MKQIAIYYNPSDYPLKYVSRGWTIGYPHPIPDEKPLYVGDSLEEAREIPNKMRLYNIGRSENDDLVLLEVWI